MWLTAINKASEEAYLTAQAADSLPAIYTGVERRSRPRIIASFPLTVQGVDASGEVFEIEARLDNLSASGLYLRLCQCIEPGATLFIVVSLSSTQSMEEAPRVALQGIVLRSEWKPNGVCGVAMSFSHYRFL